MRRAQSLLLLLGLGWTSAVAASTQATARDTSAQPVSATPIPECQPRPIVPELENFQCLETGAGWLFAREKYAKQAQAAATAVRRRVAEFAQSFGKPAPPGLIVLAGPSSFGEPADSQWQFLLESQFIEEGMRDDFGFLTHEVGHEWYGRTFQEWKSPKPEDEAYGTPGPDWLDELGAILMEGTIHSGRRAWLMDLYKSHSPQLQPLADLFSMEHPVNAGTDPTTAAAFYAEIRGVIDFFLERGKDPTIWGSIVTSGVNGVPIAEWLQQNGARYNLPTTMEGLEQEWQDWLAQRAKTP